MSTLYDDIPERPSISLFSNCGAGDYGYRSAGFSFVVMAELVKKRLRVAGLNHPGATMVSGDLRSTWTDVVEAYQRHFNGQDPWLLSACPPCQGMSSANSNRGKGNDVDAGARDPRNLLVLPIVEVAMRLQPRAVVVENVPAFLTRKVPHPKSGEARSAASLLVEMLAERYVVFPLLCDLAHYGVPQRRREGLPYVHPSRRFRTRCASRPAKGALSAGESRFCTGGRDPGFCGGLSRSARSAKP